MSETKAAISSVGGTLDDFFAELGVRDEVYGAAIKEVIAWQIETALKEKAISKVELAKRMKTSRTQVNRVLDPKNLGVSLESLESMARSIGKKLRIELVDA